MDTEDEDKEAKADDTEAGPKRSVKKWIIIVVAVLALGGGGYAAWDFLLAKKAPGKDNPQKEKAEDNKFGVIYEMEPFIVNLLGREGKRYLKTAIEFEVDNDTIRHELTQRTSQLRDAILLLLTSKSFEDISKPEGKLRLKNELITRVNQILPGAGVRTLYFTEFIVQ